ncbi:unnamed protein product [Cylindrotheca closterium]|uniref:Uncharacterized protein n=1 Tax=Cylindrotheca closterium TaxID=2856 RepID=A0AAD2G3R9_9STRA|nr:unnamed protein product [Cylindrotheca closterium]
MPSYGAVDTQRSEDAETNAADNSFEEMDMRFLKEQKVSQDARRRKVISALVPILVALVIILLFAKISLGAIGPAHDPKYPTEYGSKAAPAPSPKSSTPTGEEPSSVSAFPPASSYSSSSNTTAKNKNMNTTSTSITTTASCSENRPCYQLGLTGQCCPTGEGVMLGCCQ